MRTSRIIGLPFLLLATLFISGAFAQSTTQSSASPSSLTASAPEHKARVLITIGDEAVKPIYAPAKDTMVVYAGGKPAEIEEIRSLRDEPLVFSMLLDISTSTQQNYFKPSPGAKTAAT